MKREIAAAICGLLIGLGFGHRDMIPNPFTEVPMSIVQVDTMIIDSICLPIDSVSLDTITLDTSGGN